MTVEISRSHYGTTANGEQIDQYQLSNSNGIDVGIINYGGIINSLRVPDRNGDIDDVVLGYDSLTEYEACRVHFGCITGRYANRISNGRFTIDDNVYQLEVNRPPHHLHGATAGFGKAVWQAEATSEPDAAALLLRYLSADGNSGYPGNLQTEVVYRLTEHNELLIEYRATTDRPTILNLTNHSYFNLRGHQHALTDGVLDHRLCLFADQFVPTDDAGIPLGGVQPVDGTPLDFRQGISIGARIDDRDVQLLNGRGYDHNWIANDADGKLSPIASVTDPASGRTMKIATTQPGVQFYSGNNLLDQAGKAGVSYGYRGALCLETQHFPDSPNNPDFPNTILRPGENWCETARFTFSADKNML